MPIPIRQLPRTAKIYVAVVIAGGIAAVSHSAVSLIRDPVESDWLILAALTLATGSLTIKIPTVSARLSVSEVFVSAAVLWYGPAVATFIVTLETFVGTLWLHGENRAPVRTLFNISAAVTAIFIAGHLFELLRPTAGLGDSAVHELLLPVLFLALCYFIVNSFLVATALGFEHRTSPFELWWRNFLWLGLSYLVGGSVAVLLVAYSPRIDLSALSLIVPLLVITYLTFRMSLGRLEDANNHVAQLNEMYLSTIETLAMAVDAKDQITHGHIRRVQVYTVELAKRMGVRDAQQLQAIEAAALLHDMGKLAIPEHILNKPGKLTGAEFDNMKRHTDIGADLLSSIRFPYPVVPIVRHHHENWDGTGYPTGLSGVDIPLGARLLSVVDCFDALTSDRPYRPRLTADEAFGILRERRGKMYDPWVVDTFCSAYSEIAPLASAAGQQARTLTAHQPHSDGALGPLANIRASAAQSSTLSGYSLELHRAGSIPDAMVVVNQYARLLTPATVSVMYKYLPEIDALRCVGCHVEHAHLFHGLTIRRGERITGWVAAHRQAISNSQAQLDLMDICERFTPALQTAISVPLVTKDDQVLGVLTGYAVSGSTFSDGHRYAFERIGSGLTDWLTASPDSASSGSNLVRFRSKGDDR
jgi:putative nucleotidyltransferase with HDIG domain